MINQEEIGLAVMRTLVKRPRLADVVFRLDKWGNIMGPDRWSDPYPIYERMRKQGPVSWSPFFQQWAVVGYDEARTVLSSADFGVADQINALLKARPYSELSPRTTRLLQNALLFTDPPLHTRLRAVVSRAFTPRQMARLEPKIEHLVADRLASCRNDPAPELVGALTEPLPIQVIAELLGVPEDRWDWVTEMSLALRRLLDPFDPMEPAAADAVIDDMVAVYSELADARLSDPQDDLISVFAQAEQTDQADDRIDRAELVSLISIIMIAGHETITSSLGNAIVALGRHPDQQRLIADRPELWPNAVEEFLRFDTALQTDPRAALTDVTIGGQTIKKGQNLTVMLGAVNRDPRRWDNPDQLKLDRDQPSPLSFGHGIHHCIGAALARLQMRIALRAVTETFGPYTIDEAALAWRESLAFRGPIRLVIHPDT